MKITNGGGETSTLYRKESALTTTQRSFSKEGINYYSFGRRRRRRQLHHYGRRKRAKIGESEGKSAREDGESRRWKHAECVPLSLSFFVCIIQNELDLLCALSARILTLSFSLSLFDDDDDDRIERSGEIDSVQGVHAIVRVDFKPRGTEKTRGE